MTEIHSFMFGSDFEDPKKSKIDHTTIRKNEISIRSQKDISNDLTSGDKYPKTLKVILFDEPGIITDRLFEKMNIMDKKFAKSYQKTIGMEPISKYITWKSENICFNIWQIASESRFDHMRSMFLRNALLTMIMIDSKNKNSSESIQNRISMTHEEAPKAKICVIDMNFELGDESEYEKYKRENKKIDVIYNLNMLSKNIDEEFGQLTEIIFEIGKDKLSET